MTVLIDIDEKMWAEAESIAKDLNIDYNEIFINTLRSNLYDLKNENEKAMNIAEMERRHRESYLAFPQTKEEIEELEEVQDWGEG